MLLTNSITIVNIKQKEKLSESRNKYYRVELKIIDLTLNQYLSANL